MLAESTAAEKRLRAELAASEEKLTAMREKFNGEAQALEQQAGNMHDLARERDALAAKVAEALSRAAGRDRELSALKRELGGARAEAERFRERQVGCGFATRGTDVFAGTNSMLILLHRRKLPDRI